VWIELTRAKPLLNLKLIARRNFGFGLLANFLLGVALYGSVYLIPVYLARVQGYNAQQIGEVLAWTGLPQLALIPFIPLLMKRFDPRWLIGTGFALFAASNFMNAWMTPDYAGGQLLLPNIVRAVGQALAFTPLVAVANGGIEPANAGSASALFNMMRNLGGAIGIATLQTFVTTREQFHSNVLMTSVSTLTEATRQRIDELTQYFLSHGVSDPAAAAHQAIVAIGNTVRQQAFVMAFSDTFYLLGVALVVAMLAATLLKKPQTV
jgi:MFS transporter, DHA2 family, multidrug resistance protein